MKKMLFPTALLLSFAMLLSLFAAASALTGAPTAKNLELFTYRGASVGGRLSATDPEGDSVTFEITTNPIKGNVDLDTDGHFVYTPADGRRGKDYFGYRAVDGDGNCSQEATVIIRIEKPQCQVTYADLDGNGCACAAQRLAEAEIFVGECLAGQYVFSPETPVTRGEFLAMCMKLGGTELLQDVRSTGFSDDAALDAWAKPYVGTALQCGLISGYADPISGSAFRADQNITAAEAAAILDRTMELSDAIPTWISYDASLPAWAARSAANVSACGIFPDGCSFTDATLSRAEAAELLCGAMDLLDKR